MKGVWGFPNNKMSSSDAGLNRSFFRCVRTPDVLAILLNLNIRRYNALPLSQKQERIFFENFSFRYLRFDEEMSVVKWKGKIFAAILNKRQKGVRCKVKGFPKYFFTLPDIFAFSVRWIVKSEAVGTKPVFDSLSWIATVNGLFTVSLPSITPMKERF